MVHSKMQPYTCILHPVISHWRSSIHFTVARTFILDPSRLAITKSGSDDGHETLISMVRTIYSSPSCTSIASLVPEIIQNSHKVKIQPSIKFFGLAGVNEANSGNEILIATFQKL